MAFKDHLEPGEEIRVESPDTVDYQDDQYTLYITDKRLVLHRQKGLISKKDVIKEWNLEDIEKYSIEERGDFVEISTIRMTIDGEEVKINAQTEEIEPLYGKIEQYLP